MNTYFKKITEYFDENNISYEYDEPKNTLLYYMKFEKSKVKLQAFIKEFDQIFQANIGIQIQDYTSLSQDIIHKISEYIHRANLGLIRGSFEYNMDVGIITFKHYFEKTSVMDKKYTMYNISLPIAMYLKYIEKLSEVINTSKSPKELIDEVEDNNNE